MDLNDKWLWRQSESKNGKTSAQIGFSAFVSSEQDYAYDVVKTNGINLAHRSSSKVSVDRLLGKERGVVNQLICKFLT